MSSPACASLREAAAVIEKASFSSDGKLLVIPRHLDLTSLRNTARLINFSDRESWEDKPLDQSQQVSTRAAAFSDDGKLATAEDDGTVRIWRVDDQPPTEYLELRGHEGPVTAASFSPDGKFIATGGSDTTTRLWQLDRPKAIASPDNSADWTNRIDELTLLARKTAGRNFTREEWSRLFPDEKYHPTFPDLPSPDIGKDE
jgi:WD40 repeat protein